MTPVEERADWQIHRDAMAKAKADGLCWKCQHEAGFAATDAAHGKPRLPLLCGRCQPKTTEGIGTP